MTNTGTRIESYLDGVEITTWVASGPDTLDDGAKVVQIDTNGDVGRVRVNINESPVWDNDPEMEDGPVAQIRKLLAAHVPWLDSPERAVFATRGDRPEDDDVYNMEKALYSDRTDRLVDAINAVLAGTEVGA
jgi:hypothetical protein